MLLAVDDLPYLDAASASAVTFALRRMEGRHPARLLATIRNDDLRLPVLQGLPSDRSSVISVGPLTLGALFDLLQTRRGIRLARPLLLRVYETSGGNPLYALELARALDRLEISPKPGTPLPVPAGLDALVDARVRDLPAEVAEVVAATAAAWRFTANDEDAEAVELAVAAGMVVVDEPAVVGGARVIRAAHPLLERGRVQRPDRLPASSSCTRDSPPQPMTPSNECDTRHWRQPNRRPLSRRISTSASTAALAAGVPDIAVGLAQLSLEHTTDVALRPARLDRLADAQLRSGDSSGAWQTQSEAIAATAPGAERARRRIRLAEIAVEVTGWADAERELQVAIAEAADDPLVLAEALLTLAAVTDDIDVAETSAQRAVDLLVAQDRSRSDDFVGRARPARRRALSGRSWTRPRNVRAGDRHRARSSLAAALRSRRRQLRGAAEVRR